MLNRLFFPMMALSCFVLGSNAFANVDVQWPKNSQIKVKFNAFLERIWDESAIMKSFDPVTPSHPNAKVVVIADASTPDSRSFARGLQKRVVSKLSGHYQSIGQVEIEVSSGKMLNPRYDKALYQARTLTYLEDSDYYVIVVGERFGTMTTKMLADIEYIDQASKALVFVGSDQITNREDVFFKIKTFANTFRNLKAFEVFQGCETELAGS